MPPIDRSVGRDRRGWVVGRGRPQRVYMDKSVWKEKELVRKERRESGRDNKWPGGGGVHEDVTETQRRVCWWETKRRNKGTIVSSLDCICTPFLSRKIRPA